jgi:hypothetical protein
VSLKYLLDENISHVIATQVRSHRPEIHIESVYDWRDGAFLSQRDDELLRAAAMEELTLVTYDQNTIPPLFFDFVERGEDHGGVIFIDRSTIASNEFGALVRSLTSFWNTNGQEDWTNRVAYLTRLRD